MMEKRLSEQRNLTRRLRRLFLLYALLLVPLGVWAEDYDLWIGDVQVTTDNWSNIQGSNIKVGYARFIRGANGSNTLELHNIQTYDCIKSELGDLEIKLYGHNRIGYIANDEDNPAIYTESGGTLTLTKGSTNASLYVESMQVESVIYGFDSFVYTGFSVEPSENANYSLELGLNSGEYGVMNATFYTGNLYPLWVGGTQVSSANQSDIRDDNISAGTLSFDPETNTLTMTNVVADMASDDNDFVETTIPDLTVKLLGTNEVTLNYEMYQTDNCFARYTGEGAETTPTLTFDTQWGQNAEEEYVFGSLTVKLSSDPSTVIDGISEQSLVAQGYTIGNTFGGDNPCWRISDDLTDQARVWYDGVLYDLSVANVRVTSANVSNVLGDAIEGIVSFDAATNTLTLDNAAITVFGDTAVVSRLENLTVFLVGSSTITCQGNDDCAFKGTGEETVTFTTNPSAPGHLQIQVNNEAQLFTDITPEYTEGLSLKNDGWSYTLRVYLTGTGTSEDPLLIKNAADLKILSDDINNGIIDNNVCVQLYNNIDCSELEDFSPIGNQSYPFIGTFDGNNKIISHLTCTTEDEDAALFYRLGDEEGNAATVNNLTLQGSLFGGGEYNGAIACRLENGTIDNCTVDSCIVFTSAEMANPCAGGVVGYVNDGSVTNCTVTGLTLSVSTTVEEGTPFAGGIVAQTNHEVTISQCVVTGTENKPTDITCTGGLGGAAGGIIGISEGSTTVSNNTVSGNTTVNSIDPTTFDVDYSCAGAIVGNQGEGTFTNNFYHYSVTTSTKKNEDDAIVKDGYMQRGTGIESVVADEPYYDIIEDNGAVLTGLKSLTIQGLGENCGYEIDVDGYLPDYDNITFNYIPEQTITLYLYPEGIYTPSVSLIYADTEGADPTSHPISKEPEAEDDVYTFTMPNAEATLNVTLAAKPSIWIGSVEVREDGTFPDFDEEVASFDSETNTLTLNGINYSGEITSGLDQLIIKVTGTNNQINKIVSLNPTATLTFERASGDAAASLSLSTAQLVDASAVISGFSNVDFGDMYLYSSNPGQYDTTDKLLVNPTLTEDNEITSATITSAVTYPLWVGGAQVTADNKDAITGIEYVGTNDTYYSVYISEEEGGSLVFNPKGNVLTMTNAMVGSASSDLGAPIISGLPNLVININGHCNFSGYENGFINDHNGAVVSINSAASLVFTSNYPDESTLQIDCYPPVATGFNSISTANQMIYKETSNYFWVEKLQSPYLYVSDGYLMLSGDFYNDEPVEYHYIITDAEGVAGTEKTFDAENPDVIDAPCTVEAWAIYQEQTSDRGKAKNFGPVPNPFRLVWNADPVDFVLAPAIEEDDGIEITDIEANVTYSAQTGKISSSTMGRCGGSVSMSSEGKTSILNNYFYMDFEVVPPAPTVSLEAGSYLATHDPITLTGTGEPNTTIMYAWNDGEAQEYTEAIPFQTGTLVVWEVYTGDSMPLPGDTTTVVYTLATELDITFAESQTWATYYATKSLTTPEGLTAYVVSSADVASGTVTTQIVDYIPMNQAVLLKRSDDAPLTGFIAAPYTDTGATFTNLLLGSAEAVSVSSINSGDVYVLYNNGFTRATTGTISPNRGYLLLTANAGGNSRLAIIEGMASGIAEMRNGKSEMRNENEEMRNAVYDLQGRRVHTSQPNSQLPTPNSQLSSPNSQLKKGLYIINGKKTVVK